MKNILVLFYYPKKKFYISNKEIKNLKKNYTNIILYNPDYKVDNHTYEFNKYNLNNIKNNYKKLGIDIDLKKIYEINYFLKKLKIKIKIIKFFLLHIL